MDREISGRTFRYLMFGVPLTIRRLRGSFTGLEKIISIRGDERLRVVFLGNTLVQRAADYGHLEASLTRLLPERGHRVSQSRLAGRYGQRRCATRVWAGPRRIAVVGVVQIKIRETTDFARFWDKSRASALMCS